jgi:23S rRNA pseudouridine955/2504/2580 synthase
MTNSRNTRAPHQRRPQDDSDRHEANPMSSRESADRRPRPDATRTRTDRPTGERSYGANRGEGRPERPTGERSYGANRGGERDNRSQGSNDSRGQDRQKPWENRGEGRAERPTGERSYGANRGGERDNRSQGSNDSRGQKPWQQQDQPQEERQPAGRGNPAARGPARVGGRPPTHQSPRSRPVVDRTVDQREHVLRSTLETEHLNDDEMDQVAEDAWQQVTWFSITEYQAGQRLDNFLINRLKGVPKTRIYRLIREGEVRVNKGRVRADTRLVLGDQVRVAPIRRHVHNDKTAPVIGEELAAGLAARVIFEDDGLIILNKPAGLAVHGGSGVPFGVIEALRQALGKSYLELVHRIDRDTSGLLMISKKRSTLKRLQDDLRDGRIRKTYTALVKGNVLLDKQKVDAPLLRHELPNGERRVRVSTDGKPSQTEFVVKARLGTATLVEASPLTGRTHQIRVHGLSIGHPLVGDDKYGHERIYGGPQPRRLCLHATRLQIPSYDQVFEAPLPEDISSLIEQLREQAKDSKPVKGKVPKATDAVWHPDLGI